MKNGEFDSSAQKKRLEHKKKYSPKKPKVDGPGYFGAVLKCGLCDAEVTRDAIEYPSSEAATAALRSTTPRAIHECSNGDKGTFWLSGLRRVKV